MPLKFSLKSIRNNPAHSGDAGLPTKPNEEGSKVHLDPMHLLCPISIVWVDKDLHFSTLLHPRFADLMYFSSQLKLQSVHSTTCEFCHIYWKKKNITNFYQRDSLGEVHSVNIATEAEKTGSGFASGLCVQPADPTAVLGLPSTWPASCDREYKKPRAG